jgi:hypothetical protein
VRETTRGLSLFVGRPERCASGGLGVASPGAPGGIRAPKPPAPATSIWSAPRRRDRGRRRLVAAGDPRHAANQALAGAVREDEHAGQHRVRQAFLRHDLLQRWDLARSLYHETKMPSTQTKRSSEIKSSYSIYTYLTWHLAGRGVKILYFSLIAHVSITWLPIFVKPIFIYFG